MTAHAAYQGTEILSKSPEQLILLLYRRLLGHLRQGAEHLSSGDLEAKGAHFQKASAILYELAASLDPAAGGEIAGQLAALYSFFIREISAASRSRDRNRVDRIIEMLSQLNDSWIAAARELGETQGLAS